MLSRVMIPTTNLGKLVIKNESILEKRGFVLTWRFYGLLTDRSIRKIMLLMQLANLNPYMRIHDSLFRPQCNQHLDLMLYSLSLE